MTWPGGGQGGWIKGVLRGILDRGKGIDICNRSSTEHFSKLCKISSANR